MSAMTAIPKIVLLIESSRASGRAILSGVANYARYHGPWSFYWEPAGLEQAGPILKTLDADGIILRDSDKLDEVKAAGIPAVVFGYGRKEIPGFINLETDSDRVGLMGAEHLLQCGFKNFAYCSYPGNLWAERRGRAFVKRINAAGFKVELYNTAQPSDRINWPSEHGRLSKWLASLPKPAGVMACNDDCGVQMMAACKMVGLPVPDAVGVVGADNDELVCGLANPAMSSVALNFERAGYESARALDQLMRGRRSPGMKIIVQATHVVPRRSTDMVAVADAAVARALRFIQDNTRRPVVVADVAKSVGLSRRVLERRFRRELNSSVLAEIRRVRTDQMARLLVETNLPVNHIAESLGFADLQHFARYFRAGKKISPLAYRRQYGARPVGNV